MTKKEVSATIVKAIQGLSASIPIGILPFPLEELDDLIADLTQLNHIIVVSKPLED